KHLQPSVLPAGPRPSRLSVQCKPLPTLQARPRAFSGCGPTGSLCYSDLQKLTLFSRRLTLFHLRYFRPALRRAHGYTCRRDTRLPYCSTRPVTALALVLPEPATPRCAVPDSQRFPPAAFGSWLSSAGLSLR